MDRTLVFPHQLFRPHPAVSRDRPVWLVYEDLFFTQFDFHPSVLVYRRATMRAWAAAMREDGYTVEEREAFGEHGLAGCLARAGAGTWHWTEPDDDWLERRVRAAAQRAGARLVTHDSPGFLLDRATAQAELTAGKRYHQTDFYVRQRKRFGWLLEGGEPAGGRWTYDTENRKKLPKGLEPPEPRWPGERAELAEARAWVAERFGRTAEGPLPWALTHADARRALADFCAHRLHAFGDYQDALDADRPWLYHALLSPMLNAGLLTPRQVIDAALERHSEDPVPLNALEGFVRQVAGWREYLRAVYHAEGRRQRTANFWGFGAPLPRAFAEGRTGWPPLDDALAKTRHWAWAHHIERLMVLGNALLLAETRPDAVYAWFMGQYVDAFDWVMVPNVYGMSQYADGGLITTKPYLSGSNYIRQQSRYPAGDWCAEWDALYWRFVWTHREVFAANPRMGMMARLAERMDAGKRRAHLDRAEAVLARWRG